MRTGILIGRRHGETAFELICGPETPLPKQKDALREGLTLNGVHGELAEVQLWTSDGGLDRRVRFKSPTEAKATQEAQAPEAPEKPKEEATDEPATPEARQADNPDWK
jgi:hypothetical protein